MEIEKVKIILILRLVLGCGPDPDVSKRFYRIVVFLVCKYYYMCDNLQVMGGMIIIRHLQS